MICALRLASWLGGFACQIAAYALVAPLPHPMVTLEA